MSGPTYNHGTLPGMLSLHQLMLCEITSVSEYLGILLSKLQYTACTGVHYLESQAPTIPDQFAPT